MASSNLEILAYEATDLGPLCLRRRELLSSPGTVVTEITLDQQFLMSSLYTASEEALARVAFQMHPGTELDVLVGGLGLGYTADAYAHLLGPAAARWDLILVDIDHAPQDRLGDADDPFYTVEACDGSGVTSRRAAYSGFGPGRRARPSHGPCAKSSRPSASSR